MDLRDKIREQVQAKRAALTALIEQQRIEAQRLKDEIVLLDSLLRDWPDPDTFSQTLDRLQKVGLVRRA